MAIYPMLKTTVSVCKTYAAHAHVEDGDGQELMVFPRESLGSCLVVRLGGSAVTC